MNRKDAIRDALLAVPADDVLDQVDAVEAALQRWETDRLLRPGVITATISDALTQAERASIVAALAASDPTDERGDCFYCLTSIDTGRPHYPSCPWLRACQLTEKPEWAPRFRPADEEVLRGESGGTE